MLRLLALLCCVWLFGAAEVSAAPTFPALTGRVVDTAEILSPETEARIEQQLAAHERTSGGQQVVVATVPSLQGQAIEEYGYQLGRAWGIGVKDKNTGAILLVAPTERQVRIEVGYGLEGTLTDAMSRLIIERDIVPAFRTGKMEQGVENGVRGILAVLSGDVAAQPAQPAQPAIERDPGALPPLGLIFMFLIFMFLGRRRRRGLLPGVILGSPGLWGGGGLGGGGGGSRDIFRGGGGSFGGGGASGRW
jgi:uncharacterized protein